MKAFKVIITTLLLSIVTSPCFAMISVGELSKDEAKELGITMKHRKNGDAGVKVWLEFKKEGFLEKFTYCELRMVDATGDHVVSAMLQPNPVNRHQPTDVVSIAFSADPAQLERCAFLLVAYGSTKGDVGYMLHVKDFLSQTELQKESAEPQSRR